MKKVKVSESEEDLGNKGETGAKGKSKDKNKDEWKKGGFFYS